MLECVNRALIQDGVTRIVSGALNLGLKIRTAKALLIFLTDLKRIQHIAVICYGDINAFGQS